MRSTPASIYEVFSDFYLDLVNRHRADVQVKFDGDLRKSAQRRNDHKSKLGPKLVDSNRAAELDQLCSDERQRTEAELASIERFRTDVTDIEYRDMRLYSTRLPAMTALLFELFDAFPVAEDLVPGQTVSIQRKTMKDLLKDKERRTVGANDPNGRPFHTREWPPLPIVMGPLLMYDVPKPEVQQVRKKKMVSKDLSQAKIEINVREMSARLTSLDTPLNRGVIVERNRNYKNYQAALAKRLQEFQLYIDSLAAETDAFTSYWQNCIAVLWPPAKPD
jgi:hypothetical protein